MSHVFISYAHEDEEYVQKLYAKLTSEGVPAWFDKNRLKSGDDMLPKIHKAIYEAVAFIVVMSPAAAKSRWVPIEISYAEGMKKPPFPLRYKGDFRRFNTFALYRNIFHLDVTDGNLPTDGFYESLRDLFLRPVSAEGHPHYYELAWKYLNRGLVEKHDELNFTVSHKSSISLWRTCIIKAKRWEALSYAPDLWDKHELQISQDHQQELIAKQGLSRIFVFDSEEESLAFYIKNKEIVSGGARWIVRKILEESVDMSEQHMMLDFAIANSGDYVLWFQLNREKGTLERATLTIDRGRLDNARTIYAAARKRSKPFG